MKRFDKTKTIKDTFLKNKFQLKEILFLNDTNKGDYWICDVIGIHFTDTINYDIEVYDYEWEKEKLRVDEKYLQKIDEKYLLDQRDDVIYTPTEDNYFLVKGESWEPVPSCSLVTIEDVNFYRTEIIYTLSTGQEVEVDLSPLIEGDSLEEIEIKNIEEEEEEDPDDCATKADIEKILKSVITKEDIANIFWKL